MLVEELFKWFIAEGAIHYLLIHGDTFNLRLGYMLMNIFRTVFDNAFYYLFLLLSKVTFS